MATPAGEHAGHHLMRQQERHREVDSDHRRQLTGGVVGERCGVLQARVVDHNVERTDHSLNAVNQRRDLIDIGKICRHRLGPDPDAAQLRDDGG